MMRINKEWFLKKIKGSKHRSLRQVASAMGLDHSALSRTLDGEREIRIEEIRKLSELLDVDWKVLMINGFGFEYKE